MTLTYRTLSYLALGASIAFIATIMLTGKAPAGTIKGKASYYGHELAGKRTASGARFNPRGFTAAHRSLPFGTRLKVTHRGRSVIVTVNDRGPFVRGRVLDISKGAASAIGLVGKGVGHIVAEVQ